ncbi:MAG: hypothetical protein IJW01_04170 [Paludibacteraceae bacterium]|nr:hypothetical protein [Paludibacteraceae bacterium]
MMQQFQIEYVFQNISTTILWQLISSAQGLEKWYAESCEFQNNRFIFSWGNATEEVVLLRKREGESIRFHREESEKDTFFELQINVNPLTKDVTLTVIDFAEEDEIEDSTMLWNKQIEELRKSSGI